MFSPLPSTLSSVLIGVHYRPTIISAQPTRWKISRCSCWESVKLVANMTPRGFVLTSPELHNGMRWRGPLSANVSLSAGSLRQIQHINLTNGRLAHVTVRWRSRSRSCFVCKGLSCQDGRNWRALLTCTDELVSSQMLKICPNSSRYTETDG